MVRRKEKEKIDELIRVDHAGELGAKHIYLGQLYILKNNRQIQEMHDHEVKHLEYFEEQIVKRSVRPSLLTPLWKVGGFALGAVTAILGQKAAMACTVAVEEVICEHYQEQEDNLGETDLELRSKIREFRLEEDHHKNIGINYGATELPYYLALSKLIKGISRVSIAVAKRI